MARLESVALGGYFKTPQEITPIIARLINVIPGDGGLVLADPCAGDGEALVDLRDNFPSGQYALYACELEMERAHTLKERVRDVYRGDRVLEGDAFCLSWAEPGVDILYLNPPYDYDRDHKRLEQRFLDRFTGSISPGGVLLFVVPGYALEASAEFIATHYESVSCHRFPDPHYEGFKQVVLVGVKRKFPLPFASGDVKDMVLGWASGGAMPVLGDETGVVTITASHRSYVYFRWKMSTLDVKKVQRDSMPWTYGSPGKLSPVHGTGLDTSIEDLIRVRYETVLPPRAAHVAVALASGLVNGHDVHPDDPTSGLPQIMVKGVFTKEFKTVEEKKNKDGDVKSVVQVQQPRLSVTVLNMDTWTYHDLKNGSTPTGSSDFDDMNVADLLSNYGKNLAELMYEQCPALYDPREGIPGLVLPEFGLKPFRAQRNCIEAGLKSILAGDRASTGENLFLLGEVGTGKTMITLCILECLSSRHITRIKRELASRSRMKPVKRALVVCPPHLVSTWQHEVFQVLPGARVEVLANIEDVNRAALAEPVGGDLPGSNLVILIMNREMAKLGHSLRPGLDHGRCPGCGANIAEKDTTKKRARCNNRTVVVMDDWARAATTLARGLAAAGMSNPTVSKLVPGRMLRLKAEKLSETLGAESRLPQEWYREHAQSCVMDVLSLAWRRVMSLVSAGGHLYTTTDDIEVVRMCLLLMSRDARDAWLAEHVGDAYKASIDIDSSPYGSGRDFRKHLREFFLFASTEEKIRSLAEAAHDPRDNRHWGDFYKTLEGMYSEEEKDAYKTLPHPVCVKDGFLRYGQSWQGTTKEGDKGTAWQLFDTILGRGSFRSGKECGTHLYQADPSPRRYPLARYIAKRLPDLFDFMVVDEAHEYSHDGSAQERSVHRLTEIGTPVLMLTGTSNNGYSSSLFSNTWAISRKFRKEFGRDDLVPFINRYGYRKVKVDAPEGKTIPPTFGKMSDRVDDDSLKTRVIGEAPGVLPLFVFRHMLPGALVIHKEDLDLDLPPLREFPVGLSLPEDSVLMGEYHRMRSSLMDRIKNDMFSEDGLAGKLWGAMSQLPTFLDRPHRDTGNCDWDGGRRYEIRYPEAVGGELVCAARALDEEHITTKEAWLLNKVAQEVDEGRPVMVFVWNTNSGLSERIHRLLTTRIGNHVAILDAGKVPAGKRQAWIDAHVVSKKKRALVVNPKAVETGLNNLTYFPTAVWFQNPNCSPIMYGQANGRIHRPGQKSDDVRVFVPYYAGTSQEAQFALLGRKVQASRQTDGLDIASALAAAGVTDGDDDNIDAMTVGRAIYEILSGRSV